MKRINTCAGQQAGLSCASKSSRKAPVSTVSSSSPRAIGCLLADGGAEGLTPQKRRKPTLKKTLAKELSGTHATLVEVSIPELPPSVNAMWRSTYGKGGRTYKPKSVKDWQAQATEIIREDFRRRGAERYEGLVYLSITVLTSSKRRMDIDNRIKCLQDCLEPAGVVFDDSQVWDLRIKRRMGNENLVMVKVVTLQEGDLEGKEELYEVAV